MNITYIYLVENCYGDPNKVYIGKTISPKHRYNGHKRKFGKKIIYTIIDQIYSLDRKDWKPLETYWIQQFKAWGFKKALIATKTAARPTRLWKPATSSGIAVIGILYAI